MLRREFANAVGYLNQILLEENHLKFIHWDFHKFAKRYEYAIYSVINCLVLFFLLTLFSLYFSSKSANVLAVLGGVASEALDLTGFYYSGKPVVVKKRRTVHLSRTSTRRYFFIPFLMQIFSLFAFSFPLFLVLYCFRLLVLTNEFQININHFLQGCIS